MWWSVSTCLLIVALCLGFCAMGGAPAVKRDASKPGTIRIEIDARQLQGALIQNAKASEGLTFRPCAVMGEESKFYFEAVGTKPLSNEWQEYWFSFSTSYRNKCHILLRAEDASPERWVAYKDFTVEGIDGNVPAFDQPKSKKFMVWETVPENILREKGALSAAVSYRHSIKWEAFLPSDRIFTVRFKAKSLGAADLAAPTAVPIEPPPSYYPVYNRNAKYLPLKDKGLKGSDIRPGKFKGEIKVAEFAVPREAKPGELKRTSISVELLEESGVARTAWIRFGLPLPEKGVYSVDRIAVQNPAGTPVPAQVSVTGWWPDKSIKMALIQFPAPLAAKERSVWTVFAGNEVVPPPAPRQIRYQETADRITVDTGRMTAVIDRKKFSLLSDVTVDGKTIGSFLPEGVVLTDEKGTPFTTSAQAPRRIALEEAGPLRMVWRIDGKFANGEKTLGDYTVRLGFTADSPKADLAITYTNSNLENEFTDFSRMTLAFAPAQAASALVMDGKQVSRIFQHHDEKLETDGVISTGTSARISGSGAVKMNQDSLSFCVRNAWQRYPKAVGLQEGKVVFDLLPEQPGKEFGSDLAWYLRFPLCEGKYRMKWGMRFTEELSLDFSGGSSEAEMKALPVIAVIDRDYLAQTRVFDSILPKDVHGFDTLDARMISGFRALAKSVADQREYGFLNYGDNFGERGRNWCNNEYDPAGSLFLLFLRTGCRDALRCAMLKARHQADVDIIHAYPDRSYLGCNAEHSIGHTGVSYHAINPATWSLKLDDSFRGRNGHTWSAGMLDVWMYTGDAEVMESALLQGEQLVHYTAPMFTTLGTHERTAGWSIQALIPFYLATGDARYLKAARRIVDIALREQKFDKGGAWAHKLPVDHCKGIPNAIGNAPFLIGILTEGLRQYYRFDPDPAVKRSIMAGGDWLRRGHDKEGIGWSYGISWDGKPYYDPMDETNALIAPGVLCSGRLSGNRDAFGIGKNVLFREMLKGVSDNAKAFAIGVCYYAAIMEELGAFAREYPDLVPYSGDAAEFLKELPPSSGFRVRGPQKREFLVRLQEPSAELQVERIASDALSAKGKICKLQVLDPAGKEIFSASGAGEESRTFRTTLSGASGEVFRVIAEDAAGGVWNVPGSDVLHAFSVVAPGYSLHTGGVAVRYLTIPAGAEVQFNLDCAFASGFGCAGAVYLLDEAGTLRASAGAAALLRSGLPPDSELKPHEKCHLSVTIPKADRERIWKLVIIMAGHTRLQISGVPPLLSLAPVSSAGLQ